MSEMERPTCVSSWALHSGIHLEFDPLDLNAGKPHSELRGPALAACSHRDLEISSRSVGHPRCDLTAEDIHLECVNRCP